MNLKHLVLPALTFVVLLSAAGAQGGPIRDRIAQRMQERNAGTEGGADSGLADLGGGSAMSCADWSRRVNRLQERAQGRNAGPATDF